MRSKESQLKENVIFYKFKESEELARKMCEKYPPNEKQRHICDKLNLSYTSWSFFKGKVLKHKRDCLYHILNFLNLYKIKIPNNVDFGDVKLEKEEKMFISHYKVLEKIRENCFCAMFVPSSLFELSMRFIVKRTNLCGLEEGKWKSDPKVKVPNVLLQKLLLYKQNVKILNGYHNPAKPKGKAEIIQFFDINCILNSFKEKDEIFSNDFINWFQNDDTICFQPYKDLYIIILITFYLEDLNACHYQLFYCFKCMRQCMRKEGGRIVRRFTRHYEIAAATFFDSLKERCFNWCFMCKQTPLFQILNLEECFKEYGELKIDITELNFRQERYRHKEMHTFKIKEELIL